jgi:hypothetical protein
VLEMLVFDVADASSAGRRLGLSQCLWIMWKVG